MEGHDEHNELGELSVVKRPSAAGIEINCWLPWLLPFSLTKYSAIAAEVEGYFETEIGSDFTCYLEMMNLKIINNQLATVRFSLRI